MLSADLFQYSNESCPRRKVRTIAAELYIPNCWGTSLVLCFSSMLLSNTSKTGTNKLCCSKTRTSSFFQNIRTLSMFSKYLVHTNFDLTKVVDIIDPCFFNLYSNSYIWHALVSRFQFRWPFHVSLVLSVLFEI